MKQIFKAYSADESLCQLRVGDISVDQSTIVGQNNILFLYMGSNNYYRQYIDSDLTDNGNKWAELTNARHRRLSHSVSVLSLFVPNKATCMPDLYPLPLDVVPTQAWKDALMCLRDDSGVMFSEKLIHDSQRANRELQNAWRYCDSHWSEFGCLTTANEVLAKLGLPEILTQTKEIQTITQYGDLSRKFGNNVIAELCHLTIKHHLPDPIRSYDSGLNKPYEGSVGRRITWENFESHINLHLLIIGNSFSGSGDNSTHLTYWMSRVFRKVTFLHTGHVPTDVLDFYKPDVIIFQGLERFMISVPSDNLSSIEIESFFKN
jgi:hypothetical protein